MRCTFGGIESCSAFGRAGPAGGAFDGRRGLPDRPPPEEVPRPLPLPISGRGARLGGRVRRGRRGDAPREAPARLEGALGKDGEGPAARAAARRAAALVIAATASRSPPPPPDLGPGIVVRDAGASRRAFGRRLRSGSLLATVAIAIAAFLSWASSPIAVAPFLAAAGLGALTSLRARALLRRLDRQEVLAALEYPEEIVRRHGGGWTAAGTGSESAP